MLSDNAPFDIPNLDKNFFDSMQSDEASQIAVFGLGDHTHAAATKLLNVPEAN